MSKVRLLIVDETPFTVRDFPWLTDYFEFIPFEFGMTTYTTDCVMVSGRTDLGNINDNMLDKLLDQQFKIVADHLTDPIKPGMLNQHCLNLQNTLWYWYVEHGSFKKTNQSLYIPSKTYEKLALCPMRNYAYHRNLVYEKINSILSDSIVSYNSIGLYLLDDIIDENGENCDRHFDHRWYDSTYFTIAVETMVDNTHFENKIFISEKTFKPIAFWHPFLSVSCTGTLNELKKAGFETFENLFDESYDDEIDFGRRLDKIFDNVEQFQKIPYDTITLEKIKHNRNRFWDEDLVQQRIISEIVEPIINYAETR